MRTNNHEVAYARKHTSIGQSDKTTLMSDRKEAPVTLSNTQQIRSHFTRNVVTTALPDARKHHKVLKISPCMIADNFPAASPHIQSSAFSKRTKLISLFQHPVEKAAWSRKRTGC